MTGIFLTKEGLDKVKKELDELGSKLKKVRLKKGEAAELGGNVWHDNPSFEELVRQENDLMAQIGHLSETINTAKITVSGNKGDKIGIGSLVTMLLNEKRVEYKIVGAFESDPGKKFISYESPLGAAIFGAAVGEEREFKVGDNSKKVKILKIE